LLFEERKKKRERERERERKKKTFFELHTYLVGYFPPIIGNLENLKKRGKKNFFFLFFPFFFWKKKIFFSPFFGIFEVSNNRGKYQTT